MSTGCFPYRMRTRCPPRSRHRYFAGWSWSFSDDTVNRTHNPQILREIYRRSTDNSSAPIDDEVVQPLARSEVGGKQLGQEGVSETIQIVFPHSP